LRDLDSINPEMAKPARFVSTGAFVPLVLGVLSLLLANDAAPDVPFANNPIALFSSIILATAAGLLVAPRILKWGWEAKYFGASLFHLGSLTLMCTVPCLCLVLYGKLPLTGRMSVMLVYAAVHVWWCRRFILFYRRVHNGIALRDFIYQEEDDAVYYMQRADKQLMEKQWKFNQLPQDRYFALSLLLSFSIMPVMGTLRALVGLPFIHIFFMVSTLPISLMGLGFATRAWLVFYWYPAQIRKRTGKRVYVDMCGKPRRDEAKRCNI
jgi:hypothetical protein